MLFTCLCTCNICKAPLDICIFPSSENEVNWLFTYALIDPIDLSLNQSVYKFRGYKLVRLCIACYDYTSMMKKYSFTAGRETSGRKPPRQITHSQSYADVDKWVRDVAAYSRRPDVVQEVAPIVFLWLYWTLIPGLCLLYQT